MKKEDIEYEFQERSAILEFDAGMAREQAEAWSREWVMQKYGVVIP